MPRRRVMTSMCDDCGNRVEITSEGIAAKHLRTVTIPAYALTNGNQPDYDIEENCPGSGLRPLHVEAGEVYQISGGRFEENRAKH